MTSYAFGIGVLTAVTIVCTGTAAWSQAPKLTDIEQCNASDRTPPDLQISGCTAVIESTTRTPQMLAVAYNNRGNAHFKTGNYDQALQDYDRSIKINPSYAKAFNNRGVAYKKKGETDRAIKDFDSSIKFDANYASAFANRASAYL